MHLHFFLGLATTAWAMYEYNEIIPSRHRVCNPNELGLEDYYGFVVHHQVTVSSWPNLHHTRVSECENSYVQQHDLYHPNEPGQDTVWGKKLCSVHNNDHTRCFMMARRRRYAGLKYSLFVPNMWIGTLFECDWRNPKDPECINPIPMRPLISDNLVLANWYETPDGFKHMVRRIPMFYTTNKGHPVPANWNNSVDPWEQYTYSSNEESVFSNVATNLQSWFHTLNRIGQQEPLDIDEGDGRPRRGLSAPIDLSYKNAFHCWDDVRNVFWKCPPPKWKEEIDAEKRKKPDYHNRLIMPMPMPPLDPPREPNDFDDPLGLPKSRLPEFRDIPGIIDRGRDAYDPFYDPVFEKERAEWHKNNPATTYPVMTAELPISTVGPSNPLKHSFNIFSGLFKPRPVIKEEEELEEETWGFFDIFQPKPRRGQSSIGLMDKILYGNLPPAARPGGAQTSYTGGYRTYDQNIGSLVPVIRPTTTQRKPGEFDFTPLPMEDWISLFTHDSKAPGTPVTTSLSVKTATTSVASTVSSNNTMPMVTLYKAKKSARVHSPTTTASQSYEEIRWSKEMERRKKEYEEYRRQFGPGYEELPPNSGHEWTEYSSFIDHNRKTFARKEQRQKEIEEMKTRNRQKRDDLDEKQFFLDEPVSVGEGPIFYSVPAADQTLNVTVPSVEDLKNPAMIQRRSLSSRLEITLTDMIDTFDAVGEKKYRQLMKNVLSALESIEDV
ncbi:YALI0E28402p [Yarrowia lipolytica CLIB122]|uniref:YALI0E28402p n=2 Tax=Yarrowia lipolytica TaxID=4952 RepID=Q6C4A7_YARLI|nr:YALI0E28402p [Yarrowia lipolytica CLIB122]AOW06083.1 hypothetical protein YALI1_E33540g [Yarrowia lipolytica]KAJ8057481.1 hypothetical protein LXG23DRAFT_46799 [Yarrowia lipolytica]CAG80108.1 YALI0E28402p [Yarrowia lipolytica CLIB122]VBB77626.1 Hypothetical protein conserved in the Yarrowia clade [Yarrowia lipolytica]|eukprot:XP_504505.1 YALI0E28402p [Yarrowia lipolytica CLIB122]